MTAKEKAQELVNKFRKYAHGHDDNNRFSPAMEKESGIQCALILVNEMLNNFLSNKTTEYGRERYHFWQQVKQEIEKL
jgi:hypothetical protein